MIALFGLGAMGAGIAAHLARTGHDIVGVDPDKDRRAEWHNDTGKPVHSTAADLDWSTIDIALVIVRTKGQLWEVYSSIPRDHPARTTTFVALTTLSISEARELGKGNIDGAIRMVEAPISGGVWAAEDGTLSTYFFAPGGLTPAERAVFDGFSSRLFELGAYGEPALAKLANNTLGAYNALATAQMIQLAAQGGLAPGQFLEIVNVSSGQSWMSEHFHEFPSDLLFKDVSLLQRDLPELPVITMDDALDNHPKILQLRHELG